MDLVGNAPDPDGDRRRAYEEITRSVRELERNLGDLDMAVTGGGSGGVGGGSGNVGAVAAAIQNSGVVTLANTSGAGPFVPGTLVTLFNGATYAACRPAVNADRTRFATGVIVNQPGITGSRVAVGLCGVFPVRLADIPTAQSNRVWLSKAPGFGITKEPAEGSGQISQVVGTLAPNGVTPPSGSRMVFINTQGWNVQ